MSEEKKVAAEDIDDVKDQILTALESVIDPELGIDIVNLGLIYGVDLNEEGLCHIKMTLTIMGCPLSDLLNDEITQALNEVPEVKDVDIELVWYPAWSVDKMSRYARIALGIR
ncbi:MULTISPECIES: metal-sulfur cluster assembly factor [Loigolactobacillus]|uniref:Aromatic ring hydroxylase n=1 Tax=Loigolactobacillus backii TaxID=375175 RepID=A0A192H3V6_9LACO|nr:MULTISPECIES: metal-sulfur cluster assembly factor [Loigolactobacillus]ANK59536.1 aromatic ring hydroxylase [Loigolactobacillus backii]ANK62902.1 aromatic ring hydroxylase [Loigolactobacillus backii]ANK64530.1 aromatic ring hydroxylase [Loigolactobacillus backii]ANK67074.1 aromatic ring hydroxylase [Loigolactobacillus backii]ANK70090.1 aromatic ring hydroxylase [Loigolactobacillus backii]